MIELPSQERLQQLLDYDPETGIFVWRSRGDDGWDKRWAGKTAFPCLYGGYMVGSLGGRRNVGAHRVAYKIYHGVDAEGEVDHINGDRSDNRISNLRVVTSAENKRNAARPRTNTSGHVGIAYRANRNRWRAVITIDNRSKHIGHYRTLEEALAARKQAERDLGFHENHGRAR